MRATALEVTGDRAVVELTPCWIARWFGARTVRIELSWKGDRKNCGAWHAVNTGEELRYLPHSSAIKCALDFRPVAPLPEAMALKSPPARSDRIVSP